MMRCIVVEDEKIILDELCILLNESGVKIEGAFQDPYKALAYAEKAKPDAAFLDIEMPGLNGIDLARKIAAASPLTQIVFTTAYEQYALKAFEVRAVHYLLKPLTSQKLSEAITRVQRVISMTEPKGEISRPSVIKGRQRTEDRISVKNYDSVIILKISDIIYIKSESGKTVLVTKNGSYDTRSGLQFWENRLEEYDFIRCHRSYIINTSYITKMIHVLGEYKELSLNYCDVNIPISRNKVGVIRDWLGII